MSPSDLRLRFLTALGLPVAALLATDCKKAPVVAPDAGLTSTVPTATFRSGEPAREAAMRAMEVTLGPPHRFTASALPACARDELPETLCGFAAAPGPATPHADAGTARDAGAARRKSAARPFESCGLTGDDLEATGELSWGQTLEATVASQHPRWRAHDPANVSFKLDPLKTHKQRVDVAGNRARIEVEQPAIVAARYAALDPMRACCYSRCRPLAIATPTRTTTPDGSWGSRNVCFDAPPGGTTLPAPGDPACPAGVKLGTGPEDDVAPAVASSVRNPTGGRMCCYGALVQLPPCSEAGGGECFGPRPQNARGRPIRERGVPVVAPAIVSRDWLEAAGSEAGIAGDVAGAVALDLDALPGELRARLAAAWTRDALMEHASVASFARLALELLVLGAPPELVDAAHAAARDEIRHARFAFGIASRLHGAPRGPGPLPVSTAPVSTTLVALATETFVDGCVGETVATLEAWAARDGASDGALRVGLERIGAEEAAHAELAWRVVAWCTAEGGTPVRVALAALAQDLDVEARDDSGRAGSGQQPARSDEARADAALARFGVLSDGARLHLRTRALREVVGPCLAALLAETPHDRAGESLALAGRAVG